MLAASPMRQHKDWMGIRKIKAQGILPAGVVEVEAANVAAEEIAAAEVEVAGAEVEVEDSARMTETGPRGRVRGDDRNGGQCSLTFHLNAQLTNQVARKQTRESAMKSSKRANVGN